MNQYTNAILRDPAVVRVVALITCHTRIQTELDGLQMHPAGGGTVVLVLIQNTGVHRIKSPPPQAALDKFHLVLNYYLSDDDFEEVTSETYLLEIPAVSEYVQELAELLGDTSKLRLVTTEECLLMMLADLRQLLRIPGPDMHRTEFLTDRRAVKEFAEENGFTAARHIEFNVPTGDLEMVAGTVELALGYPVFVKPERTVTCRRSALLDSRPAFMQWLVDRNTEFAHYLTRPPKKRSTGSFKREHRASYLVERAMGSLWEVDAYFFVDGDERPLPLFLAFVPTETIFARVSQLKPYCWLVDTPLSAEQRFPGLWKCAEQAVRAFEPPANSIAGIQGFFDHSQRQTHICEMFWRFPRQRTVLSLMRSLQINCESILLNGAMCDRYRPASSPSPTDVSSQRRSAMVLYPKRAGQLHSHAQPDPALPLHGRITNVRYLVDVDEEMDDATTYLHRDVVCEVQLASPSMDQLVQDVDILMHRFQPDIRKQVV